MTRESKNHQRIAENLAQRKFLLGEWSVFRAVCARVGMRSAWDGFVSDGFFVSWCVVALRRWASRYASQKERLEVVGVKGLLQEFGCDGVREGDAEFGFVLHGALDGE